MKAFSLFIVSFFCVLFTQAQEISTFNGRSVEYGWNGKDFSESALHQFLRENFHKTPRLELQLKLDQAGITAELLWKISGNLSEVSKITKDVSSSWIWAKAKPTSFSVTFEKSGAGVILLYQMETVVGRFYCHTSSTRTAEKYNQLAPGLYKVVDKKKEHIATEPGLEGAVLRHALYSGVDGKWFHEGEYAASHGCTRVSKPAMIQFFSLVPIGTPFTVHWK